LFCIREDTVLHESDEAEMLAVGKFELEFDGAALIFIEEDDFAVVEVGPVGGSEEGEDFLFGNLCAERGDLVLDEKDPLKVFESDEGAFENCVIAGEFVAGGFLLKDSVLRKRGGKEVTVPRFFTDGSASDFKGREIDDEFSGSRAGIEVISVCVE
tara:strand:- start:74 stop:541 length:468 start_codon:yes stop_codon:yes gene_type:complete